MVRVRFAPSPTGPFHIGGARTALYNWLLAKNSGGVMILRVEDTDAARSSDEHFRDMVDCLTWLGLSWDEGPFYQSKRTDLYRAAADRLLKSGRAYEEKTDKGTAIVFKIDREPISWPDAVHGPLTRDTSGDKDLVLVKSDGTPTYNFACVVDDVDMKITHIIRGDDHVANTPKQISLYRALGSPAPVFAHIPLILNPDGSKMSKDYKKKNPQGKEELLIPTHVRMYREMGFLPDALVNFIALLGWSPGENRELMTREELIRLFSLEKVNTRGAIFDIEKLTWMNGTYLRQMGLDALVETARPRLVAAGFPLDRFPAEGVREAIRLQHEKLKRLDELPESTRFYFSDELPRDAKAVDKHCRKEGAPEVLRELRGILAALPAFDAPSIKAALAALVERRGLKFLKVAQPLRVAVTGTDVSPPIDETVALLGKERTIQRIDALLLQIGTPA